MGSNIFPTNTKQSFINLSIIVCLILTSSEPLFANRYSKPEAKIYNYLKIDLSTDSHNRTAVTTNHEDDINAAIKTSLLSYGNDKLTPSANEEIDLYTGILKLHYVDFSIPIAPGLNLEVNMVYDSAVYNYINFDQRSNFAYYDYNLPSWNIGTSYIYERMGDLCLLKNDPCDLILVSANGNSEALRRENIYSQRWESKGSSVFDGNTGILVDKRGFKYTYNGHNFTVNGG